MFKQNNKLPASIWLETLNWLYDQAIEGTAITDSAKTLAYSYLDKAPNKQAAIQQLITNETWKAAGCGVTSGIGGLLLLPVTLPANTASVLFLQIRMVMALAILVNLSVHDPRVKCLILGCLCGEVLKTAIGSLSINAMMKLLNQRLMHSLAQRVAETLAEQIGRNILLQTVRMLPLVGGAINGGLDYWLTKQVGKTALSLFHSPIDLS